MSDEAANQPEVEIIKSIMTEADAKARSALDSAKNTIEVEDAKARKESEEIKRDIIAKAEETARRLQTREEATASVEAQRILLMAREEAVEKVVLAIETELKELRGDSTQYRTGLMNLALEAVLAIGTAETRLYLSTADHALVGSGFLETLNSQARELSGNQLAVSVEIAQTDLGGGCIAQSLDGRVVFDNTFSKRLARMKEQLRLSIIEEISKNHE